MDYLLKDSAEARAKMVKIFREVGEKYGWNCGKVRTGLFMLAFVSRLQDAGIITRAEPESEKVV